MGLALQREEWAGDKGLEIIQGLVVLVDFSPGVQGPLPTPVTPSSGQRRSHQHLWLSFQARFRLPSATPVQSSITLCLDYPHVSKFLPFHSPIHYYLIPFPKAPFCHILPLVKQLPILCQ